MKIVPALMVALTLSSPLAIAMPTNDIVIPASESKMTTSNIQQPLSLVRFNENALFSSPSDPAIGNLHGTVTLVEFFDYQCIHCIAMSSVISDLVEKNPQLKVVFKVFSLGRATSTRAALAAFAAQKQGKFIDFHHALLTANQPLTDEVIFSIAKSVGLNVSQLQRDMDSRAIENKLDANLRLAQNLKIPGTPAFFVASSTQANKHEKTSYFFGEVSNASLQASIERAAK